jgi:hypothetical protein
MNTKKQIFKKAVALFAFATILFTIACSKSDSDESPTPTTSLNYMTCTLNGAEWKADDVSDAASTKFNVTVGGINNTAKTSIILYFKRSIALPNTTIPLQYTLGDSDVITVRKIGADGLPLFDQDKPIYDGSITFTKANKLEVEGTFNATSSSASNNNTITNGKFYMKFNETKIWD